MTGPIRGIATPTNACAAAVSEYVQVGNERSDDGRWRGDTVAHRDSRRSTWQRRDGAASGRGRSGSYASIRTGLYGV